MFAPQKQVVSMEYSTVTSNQQISMATNTVPMTGPVAVMALAASAKSNSYKQPNQGTGYSQQWQTQGKVKGQQWQTQGQGKGQGKGQQWQTQGQQLQGKGQQWQGKGQPWQGKGQPWLTQGQQWQGKGKGKGKEYWCQVGREHNRLILTADHAAIQSMRSEDFAWKTKTI